MKIALLLPGSGSQFYCENCVRDGSLANGLIKRGHDVSVCPLYLPLGQGDPISTSPVFYGAVGIYLRQAFPALRGAPSWISRIMDSRPALRLAGAMSGATNASGLGGLTVSMLRGEDGNQKRELDVLVRWLESVQPDVIHISNGLLLGMASRIREKLGVPIVCSLQDEDSWIDSLGAEPAAESWRLMAERAREVDLFLPVSNFYAEKMKTLLEISKDKIAVVPIGVDVTDRERSSLPFNPPVIGYLSHVAESMGFELLVDAYLLLRKEPDFGRLRLVASGGHTGSDHRFIRKLTARIRRAGAAGDVHIVPLSRYRDILHTLTLLSVPVPGGEAFGTFQLEAMACGVPVVQPALGGFPEVIRATGGGVTYMPNTAPALAGAIRGLVTDPAALAGFGAAGRDSVMKNYTLEGMIEKIEAAYRRCV